MAQLASDVLTPMSRLAHPGYFAFIPASSTFPGALGDLIAAALDIDVGSWMSAAGPSQLELVVLTGSRSWIGYPPEAAGDSGQRRLRGEHHRARVRARGAARTDVRSRVCVHGRPDALLDRAGRPTARFPARSGSGPADGHKPPVAVDALVGAIEADRERDSSR